MIALLTPTGNRPKQIELCAEFMKRQDYKGDVLWVIVDDAEPKTINFIKNDFRENWKIVKIYPEKKWQPGMNTQASNMLTGIETINKHKVEAVFIIEDDDYYKPKYLSSMLKKLNGFDIAGEQNTIYYNVVRKTWYPNMNRLHASLFQVVFTEKMIPVFRNVCQEHCKFIDMRFFRRAYGEKRKVNLFDNEHLSIGIKGLLGRTGIGFGHRVNVNKMKPDPDMIKLKELIGKDYTYYE
jgi:hypothetical protein